MEKKRARLRLTPAEKKLVWMCRYYGIEDAVNGVEGLVNRFCGDQARRMGPDARTRWDHLMTAQYEARRRFLASGGEAPDRTPDEDRFLQVALDVARMIGPRKAALRLLRIDAGREDES